MSILQLDTLEYLPQAMQQSVETISKAVLQIIPNAVIYNAVTELADLSVPEGNWRRGNDEVCLVVKYQEDTITKYAFLLFNSLDLNIIELYCTPYIEKCLQRLEISKFYCEEKFCFKSKFCYLELGTEEANNFVMQMFHKHLYFCRTHKLIELTCDYTFNENVLFGIRTDVSLYKFNQNVFITIDTLENGSVDIQYCGVERNGFHDLLLAMFQDEDEEVVTLYDQDEAQIQLYNYAAKLVANSKDC